MWVPEKETEESVLLTPVSIGIAGYYFVELIDAKTQQVKQSWSFKNLVVNQGLNSMSLGSGSIYTLTNWAAVGGGSTPPSGTDNGLQIEFSGRTDSDGGIQDVMCGFSGSIQSGSYGAFRRTRLFTEAQGNGTIAEIGFFANSIGNSIFSRALILDVSGSPTTITKTSDDQLRVTYEIRSYAPFSDVTGSFTWGSTTYNYRIRPCNVGQIEWGTAVQRIPLGPDYQSVALANGTNIPSPNMNAYEGFVLQAYSGSASGSNKTTNSSANRLPYTTGSFFRDVEYIFEPGVANFPISGFTIECFANTFNSARYETFQMAVSPPIVKNSLQRLSLTFRQSITAL